MNLSNCPCRSTVTGLQSMTTGSLGLIVQTSVSPTMLTVTSHARWWRRIVLLKPWAFRRSFTAKTGVSGGGVSRKWNLVTWGVEPNRWCNLIPARLTVKKTGLAAVFQASIAGILAAFRWRWQRGNDRCRSSFRSVPSSVGEVARVSGWSRVKGAGWMRAKRVNYSLSHTCRLGKMSGRTRVEHYLVRVGSGRARPESGQHRVGPNPTLPK